jgi:hypothetical protein
MCDKRQVIEEPCEAKVSRTVLESGGSREGVADFNHQCLHIHPIKGKSYRNGKNFSCGNCGWRGDADLNGAKNIEQLGRSVNTPGGSSYLRCDLSYDSSGLLKAANSAAGGWQ